MGGIYWLASYPKSGNTWFRTVLANYLSESDQPVGINDLNIGTIASSRAWADEVLGVDTADLTQNEIDKLRPEVYRWTVTEKPDLVRYHKIHDAYSQRPDRTPIVDSVATLGAIYILRNPLDIVPSLANHDGIELDLAIDHMADPLHCLARSRIKIPRQLMQHIGSWSQHVESWADATGIRVEILRYEDMQSDPVSAFGSAFNFMELPTQPRKLESAIIASKFEKLAAQEDAVGFIDRPAKNKKFFRKGIVGDWRETLNAAQIDRVIQSHSSVMRRFGYLDDHNRPLF